MLFSRVTIVDDTFSIRPNVDVRIDGHKISAISDEPLTPQSGERVFCGSNHLLAPALCNAHTHVPMGLLRGRGAGLGLYDWLTQAIFPFEHEMTPTDIEVGTALGLLELLASGVASFTDMYMKAEIIAEVTNTAHMKANVSVGFDALSAQGRPFWQRPRAAKVGELASRYRGDRRITIDVALHAEYTADDETAAGVAALASEHGLGLHIHLSESDKEHQEGLQRRGMTPLAWMASHGFLAHRITAAHAVAVSEEDLALMKAHDVVPVHCPSSNLKLGNGVANLRRWHELGLPFAIGTDGAASNDNLNMVEELHLATLVSRGVRHDPIGLSPAVMFAAASQHGYWAQGRRHSGLIAEGYDADLMLIDLDRPHLTPSADPLGLLVYALQASDVVMTIVDGEVLYDHGRYTTLDAERILYDAKRCTRRIERTLGER